MRAALLFEGLHLVSFLDAALRHAGRFVEPGPWWSLTAALFAALRDDRRAAGVPLLVLFVPGDHRHSFPALGRHLARADIDALDPVALPPDPPRTSTSTAPDSRRTWRPRDTASWRSGSQRDARIRGSRGAESSSLRARRSLRSR